MIQILTATSLYRGRSFSSDVTIDGSINNETLDSMQSNITSLQSKLNSAWINLGTTSIFDYFPYNDKTGIYTCYNRADLPSGISKYYTTPWYVVLKAHEKLILFHDDCIYFTGASGGTWAKTWNLLSCKKNKSYKNNYNWIYR